MNLPCVSVVIPVYNGAKILKSSLPLFLNQTLPDVEFVFVENGSSDGSFELLKKAQAVAAAYCKQVQLFQLPVANGNEARRYGLRQAKSELVTFWDCDDFPSLNLLEVAVAALLAADKDIVVAQTPWNRTILKSELLASVELDFSNTDTNHLIKKVIPRNRGSEQKWQADKYVGYWASIMSLVWKKKRIEEDFGNTLWLPKMLCEQDMPLFYASLIYPNVFVEGCSSSYNNWSKSQVSGSSGVASHHYWHNFSLMLCFERLKRFLSKELMALMLQNAGIYRVVAGLNIQEALNNSSAPVRSFFGSSDPIKWTNRKLFEHIYFNHPEISTRQLAQEIFALHQKKVLQDFPLWELLYDDVKKYENVASL